MRKPLFYALMLALVALMTAACAGNSASTLSFDDLPADGDPVRGEQIYTQDSRVVATCTACHNADASGAPTLIDYAAVAGARVEGESAREYTFYAIVEPGRYVVEGYGNAMPNRYDEELSAQDIADLIAYLLDG